MTFSRGGAMIKLFGIIAVQLLSVGFMSESTYAGVHDGEQETSACLLSNYKGEDRLDLDEEFEQTVERVSRYHFEPNRNSTLIGLYLIATGTPLPNCEKWY